MNTFKKIILISVIVFFTITFNNPVKAERDCSNPKGFHEKMMCKYQNKGEGTTSTESSKPKKGWGWLKKIREFGGKNIGSAG